MDLALYDPNSGYYATGQGKIGKQGDYFTNVSVGPVFGAVLADQFQEMWKQLRSSRPLVLVEQGANDGQLAFDLLSAFDESVLGALEYWIVEPFPILRRWQETKLERFEAKLHWVESLDALPVFEGIHFSNELVDAFPFHLIRSTGTGWEELLVATDGSRFVFQGGAPSQLLTNQLRDLPHRPIGTLAELRPAAGAWIHALSKKLRAGFVLIVDYGFSREQLLAAHRTEGTYACYR
ncbi:MAG TPA: SAM-dependent methyltransferase, partial [Terrimicrobiaceae bacterium]